MLVLKVVYSYYIQYIYRLHNAGFSSIRSIRRYKNQLFDQIVCKLDHMGIKVDRIGNNRKKRKSQRNWQFISILTYTTHKIHGRIQYCSKFRLCLSNTQSVSNEIYSVPLTHRMFTQRNRPQYLNTLKADLLTPPFRSTHHL